MSQLYQLLTKPKVESYPFVKLENDNSVLQLFACRVCLATETKLFDLHKYQLVDMFGALTGTQISITDGLPQYICSICCTQLRKSSAFRAKCRQAHILLQDARVRQPLITTDYIKKLDRSKLKLNFAITNTLTLDYPRPAFLEEFIISEQTESSTELNPLVKGEPLTPIPEVATDSNDCHNDTSEDDTNDEFKETDTKIKADKLEPTKEHESLIKDKAKKAKPKKGSQISTVKHTVKKVVEIKRKRPCNIKFIDDFDEFAENYNCKVVFLTKEQQLKEVEERKETESYKRSRFKCTICYKGFMNVSAHQNHMATHDKSSGDHECDICHSRYTARFRLVKHHFWCHKFSFICKTCDHVSKRTDKAKHHYKWHEGFRNECKECNRKFNTRNTYLRHNRKYHHSVTCELCKETVNGYKGLEKHNQQRHPIVKFRCQTCSKKFDSQEALDTHLSADGLCNSDFACVQCGENFTSKPLLDEHRETAHNGIMFRGEKKFPCQTCSKKFDSQEALDTHLSADGLCNSDFACVKCGENFTSKPLLDDHREAAHNETMYRCEQCPSAFPTSTKLALHWNTMHSGTVYMCELCAARYKSKAALNAHRRTHFAEDKLGDSKELNVDDSLQVHMNTRTGERPISCNECDATFKTYSQKYKHKSTVHKKAPRHKCHLCEKEYSMPFNLKRHIRTFHMKIPPPPDKRRNRNKTNHN